VPVLVYLPTAAQAPLPALLRIYGGFMIGAAEQDDHAVKQIIPLGEEPGAIGKPGAMLYHPVRSSGDAQPPVPAAVTACRLLSEIFVIVLWFGPFSSPPHHPPHTPSGLIQRTACRGCKAGSCVGTEHVLGSAHGRARVTRPMEGQPARH
jgi:hypothetical protein